MALMDTTGLEGFAGKSLRDEIAIGVLQGIYIIAMQEASEGSGLLAYEDWRKGLAIDAYKMADAMMEARNAKA